MVVFEPASARQVGGSTRGRKLRVRGIIIGNRPVLAAYEYGRWHRMISRSC
jgi:hypothetical protein